MKHRLHKFIKFIYIFLLVFASENYAKAQANCGCDHIIAPADLYIDGVALKAKPGDVVCVMASSKRYLGFRNFHGAPGNPIIFKNCGGQVKIKDTDWYYGMKFDNSSYFRVTGTGSPDFQYGFLIDGTPDQIAGLGIAKLSTDFEIDHFEISRTGFAGIIAKSDPDCTGEPNRGNFVQYNTFIHDNYIHETAGEGIYVGFAHYRGIPRFCDDGTRYVFPHDLKNVKIYNNKIISPGREGIQVGCAVEDVEVYDNEIRNFGALDMEWQRSGMHISTGTVGKFHNNIIAGGTGSGIWLNGKGDDYIYNNLIYNVGTTGEEGMMVYDSLVDDGKGYHFINNTLVGAKGFAIKVYTSKPTIFNIVNNIVAGVPEFYTIPSSVALNDLNNVFRSDPAEIHFQNMNSNDYHLLANSPAVDAGTDMSASFVVNDFDYIDRPRGHTFDAGAFESPFEGVLIGFFIFPNPVVNDRHTKTNIEFTLPEDTGGNLKIYDSQGRLVAVLMKGPFKARTKYELVMHDTFLAQGIYYYTLETDKDVMVKKILIVE